MVRWLVSPVACLLLCMGLAGCTGDASDQADSTSPSPAVSTPNPPHGPEAPTAEVSNRSTTSSMQRRLRRVDRDVPANADVIVAPFTGHGDRRLSIDPRGKTFGVGFRCEGQGRFGLVTGTDRARYERCLRRVRYWLTVATDGAPQVVRLHATPGITWRMAVIEGDAPGVNVKPMR
jgi:hypothetical protein